MESALHPKYSIIVCAYNMEKYLRECLDSVLAQDTTSTYEIILVNNGSLDGTGAICEEYAAKHSCIHLVKIEENRGGNRGINAGVSIAQGEYILYLDSDDLWKPNLLSTLDPLTGNQPDMVVFGNESFNESGILKKSKKELRILPRGESGESWRKRVFAGHARIAGTSWSYAWKRSFINRFHLYPAEDLTNGADVELVARALPVAESMQGTDSKLYRYRIRSDSVAHRLTPERVLAMLISSERIFKQGLGADGYCLVAAQVACLGDREKEKECIQFIKDHWDIWKHVEFRRTKIARLLLRTFGIHNGSVIWLKIRRAKYWITGEADTLYTKV